MIKSYYKRFIGWSVPTKIGLILGVLGLLWGGNHFLQINNQHVENSPCSIIANGPINGTNNVDCSKNDLPMPVAQLLDQASSSTLKNDVYETGFLLRILNARNDGNLRIHCDLLGNIKQMKPIAGEKQRTGDMVTEDGTFSIKEYVITLFTNQPFAKEAVKCNAYY